MSASSVIDMYMQVLSSLSDDEKLDLIEKLTNSLRQKRKKKIEKTDMSVFDCFHEDWGGEGSSEEVADALRKARHFEREVTSW